MFELDFNLYAYTLDSEIMYLNRHSSPRFLDFEDFAMQTK